MIKLSQDRASKPIKQAPQFDLQSAITYNSKSQQYFKKYESDIKRILNVSVDWNTPEFAQSVYDWQQKNGFDGKWVDGKLGPHTIAKMASTDGALKDSYDSYAMVRDRHRDEKVNPMVLSLKDDVDRIRKEMNATDIPLGFLLGWIQVESGGRLNDISHGAGREAGLFQVSEGEAKAIGADQDRIMQDRDYAIKTGIDLVRHHEKQLAPTITQLFAQGSDLYWRLVFMGFVNGDAAVKELVRKLQASGQQINNWDDIMTWAQYNSPYIAGHSSAKWLPHIERSFNLAKQIDKPVSASIKLRIKKAKRSARIIILDRFDDVDQEH